MRSTRRWSALHALTAVADSNPRKLTTVDKRRSGPQAKEDWIEADLEARRMEIELRKHEVDQAVDLCKLGLWGTFMGSVSGALFLIILACISSYAPRPSMNGTHLCIIAGIIYTTATLYGAFIFQRSLKVSAHNVDGFIVETGDKSLVTSPS